MTLRIFAVGALAATLLSACATAPGPVEVTRFVDPAAAAQIGKGSVFVTAAPGSSDDLALAPYIAAVSAELARIGYTPADGAAAGQVAEVSVSRETVRNDGGRGPVSVGVGGSTGSYGSGLGVGLGINLGGSKERSATRLRVVLRDSASRQSLWEGTADFAVSAKSPLAQNPANAQTLAAALLRDFPGHNAETIQVKVD